MQKGFAPVILLIVVVLLGALGGIYYYSKSSPKLLPPKTITSPSPAPEKTPDQTLNPQTPEPENLPEVVALAKKDLAEKLKVDQSQIKTEKTEETNWPDSALGCPEKGKLYLQVITKGYKAVFSFGGKQYEYHTSSSKTFVRCPLPAP